MLNGSALKRFRTRKGFSCTDVANKLGVSESYISKIESGKELCSSNLENIFFRVYEKYFDRVDKELFKEHYPYNGIKLVNVESNIEPTSDVCVVRRIRKRMNLSQHSLAKSLCVDASIISKIERGERALSKDLYDRILNHYGNILTDVDRVDLTDMIYNSDSKIVNFVLDNNVNMILEQLANMNLQKSEIKLLFSDMLDKAKTLKKTRS